ncbi:hypothetical protein EYR40_000626 [Pleurotus pulmonarius]|nr:hypothetical protein EYR40_000626 [Pleurotus pulmonarius]
MTSAINTYKALVVKKSSGSVYAYDAHLTDLPLPKLNPGQVLVKVNAAAFNHRDLWIRRGQYPGITVGSTFGADGAGVVVRSHDKNDSLVGKRVFVTPMRGWEKHPDAPESQFGVIGGSPWLRLGTFTEYVAVDRDQAIPTPSHLDDTQAAAWPLAGLTAWRATIINAQVKKGDSILITGVGGGVALVALQLCVAKGANVYVTSGKQDKLDKAIALGAKGGVNYKDKDWRKQLGVLLRNNNYGLLDAVIDSAGGDISELGKIVKAGGRFVCYGMTADPKITFTMREVMKNYKLLGSTMGSRQDLIDATKFMTEHQIVPVVSHVLDGLESADEGFELIKRGEQFGKIVIKVRHDVQTKPKL